MTLLKSLMVLVGCLSTLSIAFPATNDQPQQPAYDSYSPQTHQELPLENPPLPFNIPEPSGDLRPPRNNFNSPPSFLELEAPATDLQAPQETAWNPDNNPIYYYELPASLTRMETPTNQFPKKYNQDIHTKGKSLSSQPKIEIELVPVEEKELLRKTNALDKKLNRLAKLQNQKELEDLRVQQAISF